MSRDIIDVILEDIAEMTEEELKELEEAMNEGDEEE